MQRTHYETLGVARDATAEQIKRRFRQLAREHHPDVARERDKDASHHAFVQISEAYRVLIDPLRRADYDLMLRDRERRQTPPPGPRPQAASGPRPSPGGSPPGGYRRPPGAARPQTPRADIAHLLRSAQAAY